MYKGRTGENMGQVPQKKSLIYRSCKGDVTKQKN